MTTVFLAEIEKLSDLHLKDYARSFLFAVRDKTRDAVIQEMLAYFLTNEAHCTKVLNDRSNPENGLLTKNAYYMERPKAAMGYTVLGGGLKLEGYASEKSAQIAIAKNKWHHRNPVIVPFTYRTSGIGEDRHSRYAIVADVIEETE